MKSKNEVAYGLDQISMQINAWLKWHKEHRDKENLVTDDNTCIMALPVPIWPSHAQFETWISTLNSAATFLKEKQNV